MSKVFDPTQNRETNVIAQIYTITLTLLFLGVGGHRAVTLKHAKHKREDDEQRRGDDRRVLPGLVGGGPEGRVNGAATEG